MGISYEDAARCGIAHLFPKRKGKAKRTPVAVIDPRMTRCVLFIPGWHPTPLNRLLGTNPFEAARHKKADADIIARHCESGHVSLATTKRRVSLIITLAPGQRGCDGDAYWKSCLDSLVHAGALKNDSPAWVELMPVKYCRGDEMSSTIVLEDLG